MEATQAGHLERHLCVTLRFFLVMAGCTRPVQRDLRFIKIVFEDMDCRNTHVSPETPGAETCVVSGLILRLCCWGPISKSAPNQLSLTSLRLCSLVSEWDTSAARSSELRFVVGAGVLFGCRAHAESARYCLIGGRSSGRPPRARTWRGGMGPSCRAGCGTWSCQDWDKSWATSLGLLFVHAARRFFLLVNLSSAVVAVPTPFFHRTASPKASLASFVGACLQHQPLKLCLLPQCNTFPMPLSVGSLFRCGNTLIPALGEVKIPGAMTGAQLLRLGSLRLRALCSDAETAERLSAALDAAKKATRNGTRGDEVLDGF